MPFAAVLLMRRLAPDISCPFAPYIMQRADHCPFELMAGTAGSILDSFNQKSTLDRKAVVAIKAVTQVLAHTLRIAYFGSFAGPGDVALTVVDL